MSQVYAPPSASPPPLSSVDDDEVPKTNIWMYLAVAANMAAGLFGVAYALQMMVFIRFYDVGWVGPWMFGAVSIVVMILGAALIKARPPVVFALIGFGLINLFLSLIWHIYAIFNTLFSPLGILWFLLGLPATVLAVLAVRRVLEIGRFRKQLMQGLTLE